MRLDWVQLAQDRTQLVIMNTVMILRDPQNGGNSKDQRLKKDLVRKSGNLVEFHHMCLITVLTQMLILLQVPRPGIMYHGQTTGKISYNLTTWMMIKRRTTTVFQLPASSS
jgi:hypothetical protein